MAKDMNQAPDSVETKEMQDAARRLEQYLGTKGISLKHAVALEALTQALGAKNWRTLRAKLNEPAAAAQEVLGPDEPRWTVSAIYTDNNQRYTSDFHGDTALEAQIACQLDRLSDEGSFTEVDISCVIDRRTGKVADEESYPEEAKLVDFTEMLDVLVDKAEDKLGEPPQGRDVAAAEEYDRNMRALEFWTALANEEKLYKIDRANLDEMYTAYDPDYDGEPTMFTDSRGVEDTIDVVDAFQRLFNLASQGMDLTDTKGDPKETGVFQLLQAKLTLEYFDDRLSGVLNEAEVKFAD